MAGHILLDVATENVLNVLLLEFALDDELVVAVHGTRRSQLRAQELEQVTGLTMEPENGKKRKEKCG